MNTYLIPVTKEYQSIFTDIAVVYADTAKEAYFNAKIQRGFAPITIMDNHDVPYDFYYGEVKFPEFFFPISKKI